MLPVVVEVRYGMELEERLLSFVRQVAPGLVKVFDKPPLQLGPAVYQWLRALTDSRSVAMEPVRSRSNSRIKWRSKSR